MTFGWMIAPVAACVLIAFALGWFGLHVLEREVIFVDLALAQVAALGTTYAVFLGHEPDEPVSYVLGLVFTVLAAGAFSLARRFRTRIPQEALIGIAYAVSAGTGALLLDFADDPHGAEKLQHLMVGNVVWVTWTEIGAVAAVVATVGAVHFMFRDRFLRVSLDPEGAVRSGVVVWAWDLVFYLTFGLVITTVVHIAGVLLIFSWLVVPAVIARLFVDGVGPRLLLAWAVSVPLSIAGVAVSYEHAAGPIIVAMLGGCLILALAVWSVWTAPDRVRATGIVVAGAGAVLSVLYGFSKLEIGEHEHEAPPAVAVEGDAAAREAAYRSHAEEPAVLGAALAVETEPSLRLLLAIGLTRAGDERGLAKLAALTRSDLPFVRMEADGALRKVLDDPPAYDPLTGPDTAGGWATAAAAPSAGWKDRAKSLDLPY